MTIDGEVVCPRCGLTAARKDGRDRKGAQVHRCRDCGRRSTALTATPFSGYRFPPGVLALAVRWYARVDLSSIYAWVQAFAPLYEDAARPFRTGVGSAWSVDKTYVKVAAARAYVYRAIDGQGQIVDVHVSAQRAAEDAAAFFRRAIEAASVAPTEVATDCAAAYPPALAAALPGAAHAAGKRVQQRVERDYQHLKGRLHPVRGSTALAGARALCRAHAYLRNLRAHFYDLGQPVDAASLAPMSPLVRAWDALAADLRGR